MSKINLRDEITLMNGNKAHYSKIAIDLLPEGVNDEKIKALCLYCRTAYIERPLICRCYSNVFLKNVENGKIIE